MNDEKGGEVISFEDASHRHVHACKDEKLKKIQQAFKAVTSEKLKDARKQRRKRKNASKKKK